MRGEGGGEGGGGRGEGEIYESCFCRRVEAVCVLNEKRVYEDQLNVRVSFQG